ncbi:MAG: glycosyltransferase [Cyclobacteriaceae bacterium]
MKILFLTPWYPDAQQPGHGIFIRDQVRAIVAVGHEVRVIKVKVDYSRSGLLSCKKEIISDGAVTEMHLNIASSFRVFNQVNFFMVCFLESLRVVQSFRPDVIHGNIGYPGAFWSWITSKYCKLPVVLTEHTLLHNNFRSKVHKWFTINFIRKMDQVITVSNHSASIIEKWTGVRPVVIPNIVDLTLFRSIHSFPDTAIVQMGFLGNGFKKKGLDTLFSSLVGINMPFRLFIGGIDEKELNTYKEMAHLFRLQDKVEFVGFVPKQEVPGFMSRLHFFVSPSVFESFGVAIAEAMACGLPVVCTDSGGPGDFVNKENGILVPVGDSDALRNALLTMFRNYAVYDREAIRLSIVSRFSAYRIADEITGVYRRVISAHKEIN